MKWFAVAFVALVVLRGLPCPAQNGTNAAATNKPPLAATSTNKLFQADVRAEQIRGECINGRRYVSGRVLQILPDGLIVDSGGYTDLLSHPLNESWVAPGTVSLKRDPRAVETKEPDSTCVGIVFLTDIPKKPKVNRYDYVTHHGYPAGEITYSPVPGVTKKVRRFSAGLETAIRLNLETEAAKKP